MSTLSGVLPNFLRKMTTARLLGRTTAGDGPAQEISVGVGLLLTGGTLSKAGWTQIGSAPATSTAVAFTNIPQTYSELMIVLDGVSNDTAGGATINMAISVDNGSVYSTSFAITGSTLASLIVNGFASINGHTRNFSSLVANIITATLTSPAAIAWGLNTERLLGHTGGLNAVRFTLSAAGNFDAGTFILLAR